jgi:phenylacetate-coenzyme A ligase PaaK-like adenylate-forming protein
MALRLNDLIENYDFRIDLPLHVYAYEHYSTKSGSEFTHAMERVLTQEILLEFIRENRRLKILGHIKDPEQFDEIPFINKEFLRANRSKYITGGSLKKSWLKFTSGTTGRPVEILYSADFYLDFLYEDIPILLKKYDRHLINYNNPVFCIAVINSQELFNEVIKHPENKTGFILKIVFDENNHDSINNLLISIQTFKPEVLTIKPSLCEAIIGYFEKYNVAPKYIPKAIIVSGADFEPALREKLTNYYKTEIIELYGMTEFGIIAYECKYKQGLHILHDRIFYEVTGTKILKSINAEQSQKTGELVLSACRNRALPLIRYQTGDLVTIDESKCTCGSTDHRIIKLHGRKGKCFRFSKGEFLSPNHFNKLFQISPSIKEFQIIQENSSNLILRLMIKKNKKINEVKILKFLAELIPEYVKIDLVFDDIKYDSKFERFVIQSR